jgi:hypothetical protein
MQLEYVDTSWTVVSLSIGMGGIEILTYDWLVSSVVNVTSRSYLPKVPSRWLIT